MWIAEEIFISICKECYYECNSSTDNDYGKYASV